VSNQIKRKEVNIHKNKIRACEQSRIPELNCCQKLGQKLQTFDIRHDTDKFIEKTDNLIEKKKVKRGFDFDFDWS